VSLRTVQRDVDNMLKPYRVSDQKLKTIRSMFAAARACVGAGVPYHAQISVVCASRVGTPVSITIHLCSSSDCTVPLWAVHEVACDA
jgi:hypothetical protein